MGAAATKVTRQCVANQDLIGIRVSLQQTSDADQDTAAAVATLRGLFVDEGLQHPFAKRMIRQALGGLHMTPLSGPHRDTARVLRLPIDQHGASAAVFAATAKAHGRVRTLLTQNMQQNRIGFCLERAGELVVLDRDHGVFACFSHQAAS